jgi:hypothetical protein
MIAFLICRLPAGAAITAASRFAIVISFLPVTP